MMANIWWSLPLTLIVFFAARKLAARYKFPLLNPLLVAMVVIIPFLMLTGISYDSYFKGSEVLNDLLQPAVVALAYPLYEQLHQIRALEIDHHHLFYRQRGCDGDGDFRGIVDGRFTGNRRVNPAEISHHAYCNGGWRQYWRYSGNQRSLRDFRRHPRRCVWPYIA